MATALGQQLEVTLAAIPGLRVHRLAKSATGLARPDRHDWMSKAAAAAKQHDPDFVVVLIGSNDGQDLAPVPAKGRRQRAVHWGTADWPAAYRERVLALLRALGAPGRPVLWLGLPPMRSRSLEGKLAVIRREQRAAVLSMGEGHQYVGLFGLVRELKDSTPAKAQRHLFTADGVHFSLRGALRFMPLVRPILLPWVARATVLRQALAETQK
jgi:hypothetical protein